VVFSRTDHKKWISNSLGIALIRLLERDPMIRAYLMLLLVIFLLGAKPISFSEGSNRLEADPLQGWWIIESIRSWDGNGKSTEYSNQRGMYAFFSNQKWTTYKSLKMKSVDELSYQMVHPRKEYLGGIDLKNENGGGKEIIRGLFLLKGDRLYLCFRTNQQESQPKTCGPGKNHQLFEFIRYQPNHLVQTSRLPPSK
jgi:uncharacterized protein (TIGR03067 family)